MPARFLIPAVSALFGLILTSCTTTSPLVYRIDQANPQATTGRSMGIDSSGAPIPGSMYQSFTPTGNSLSAVSLRFRCGGSFPEGGVGSNIRIREGTYDGAVLGMATTVISGPMETGINLEVFYKWDTPLTLVSGQTYFIEWEATAGAVMSWLCVTDVNSYARGGSFGPQGNEYPDDDFAFTVYR